MISDVNSISELVSNKPHQSDTPPTKNGMVSCSLQKVLKNISNKRAKTKTYKVPAFFQEPRLLEKTAV